MTRIALITGGSSGIGKACAQALSKDGIKVAIADINEEKGQEVASELDGIFIGADLTSREGCKEAVDETVKHYGGLDILVNNAGFQNIDPIPDFPEDTWDDMLALMLTAPFLLTKIRLGTPHQVGAGAHRQYRQRSLFSGESLQGCLHHRQARADGLYQGGGVGGGRTRADLQHRLPRLRAHAFGRKTDRGPS